MEGEGMTDTLDLGGATVEILVEDPAVMRGTIAPGVVVPLHSHADPETFVALGGQVEAFLDWEWIQVAPGDVLHIPGGARHGFRNREDESAVMIVISTPTIARFFREVAGATPEHFLAVSERYGYWNATPEESAAVGLPVNA
jgi:quercetin dioxygenase-like cupin family protein